MAFTKEANDLPLRLVIKPAFDAAGAVVAVPCEVQWARRVKNDADATEILFSSKGADNKSAIVDLFNDVKTVNIPGVGVISYRKIAVGLKLMADAERALL